MSPKPALPRPPIAPKHVHHWCETTTGRDIVRKYVCAGCLDQREVTRAGRERIWSPTGVTVVTGM